MKNEKLIMNWFFNRSPTKEIQLQVKDLHCDMCAQTVREALQKVAGVKKVKVNLSQKKVTVAIAKDLEVNVGFFIKALEPTGYQAQPIIAARTNKYF